MLKAAAAFIAALTFLGPPGAYAQDIPQPNTNATCGPGFTWLNNQEHQTPCLVTAYLLSVCSPGFFLNGLVDGKVYPVPGQNNFQVNQCSCSSVVYSLLQACSYCQGAFGEPTWANWSTHCPLSETTIADFPEPIPQNTSVPAWAYSAIPVNGSWNLTTAESVAASDLPDTMPVGPTSSPSVATTPSSTPTSPSTPVPTNNASSGSNTAAIVGGVIGGLVTIGLGILAVILAIRCTRRRHMDPVIPRSSFTDRSLSGWASTTSGVITRAPMPSPPLKLYNPDDPSTWPTPSPDSVRGSPGHHRLQTSISSALPEPYA